MIQWLDEQRPESTTVEFVGGPREGERATRADRPAEIEMPEGTYLRSVQCADDGALRYVWRARMRAPSLDLTSTSDRPTALAAATIGQP